MKIQINPGTRRMLCLVGAIVAGCVFPAIFTGTVEFFYTPPGVPATLPITSTQLVPWFVMVMLLFSFIDVKFSRESVGWSHLGILAFLWIFAGTAFYVVKWATGDLNYAIMAFLIGTTPTANAAPVITNLLGRRADYATVSVVLTNLFVAFTLAPLVHLVIGNEYKLETGWLALSAITVVATPFLLAILLRNFWKRGADFVRCYKVFSFYIWMVMLFNCCAQSTAYIVEQGGFTVWQIAGIFLLAAAMCAINFTVGFWIGEKRFRRECAQSLGQKNTMFMLFVALAFFNPVVALGPTFYVIVHNIWNSIQLKRYVPEKDSAGTEKSWKA